MINKSKHPVNNNPDVEFASFSSNRVPRKTWKHHPSPSRTLCSIDAIVYGTAQTPTHNYKQHARVRALWVLRIHRKTGCCWNIFLLSSVGDSKMGKNSRVFPSLEMPLDFGTFRVVKNFFIHIFRQHEWENLQNLYIRVDSVFVCGRENVSEEKICSNVCDGNADEMENLRFSFSIKISCPEALLSPPCFRFAFNYFVR